jgi:hypothetical protein
MAVGRKLTVEYTVQYFKVRQKVKYVKELDQQPE